MLTDANILERLDLRVQNNVIRVNARETTDLEFKLELTQNTIKKSLKTIAAFANRSGGMIVFGIRDRPRELAGLSNNYLDEGAQSEIISSSLVPMPNTEFRELEYKGLRIAALQVVALQRKPCIATRNYSDADGRPPILQQGVIYARRRGQTSPISSNEFIQLLSERDAATRSEIFTYLRRGEAIGFNRAIVADPTSSDANHNNSITYFLPADAARELNVIDRARLVTEAGAPAYEIQGNIELTVPSDRDPRSPLLPGQSADEIRQDIREVTLANLPFTAQHLRRVAEHLGFWEQQHGDARHTGYDHIASRPVYYSEGRRAIVAFAQQNTLEFMETCASQANLGTWRQQQDDDN